MRFACHIFLLAAVATLGCGYHTAGHAMRIPASVRTIAVPVFVNQTQTYRIEQILTRDVVHENGFWLWAAVDNLRLAALTAADCATALAAVRPHGKVQ